DGEVKPPLITDENRWRRVIFDYPGMLSIQLMSDSRQRFTLNLDMAKRTLKLGKRDDPNWKTDLSFTQPEPELITMEGTLDGHRIRATLHRTDASKVLLTSRAFHWINEYPFN